MTAGYGRGWFMGMVVWVEEIVFIKSKGTRITRIARIRTDLGFYKSAQSVDEISDDNPHLWNKNGNNLLRYLNSFSSDHEI